MAGKYCYRCSAWTRPVRRFPSYIHSVLVVASCGLYFPIWLLLVLFGGGYICRACGDDL